MARHRASDQPNAIDVQIGARLRALRRQRHVSQEALGSALSVSFQQIHKYETGANRLSVARLLEIARYLETPTIAFLEGLPIGAAPRGARDLTLDLQ